MFHLTCAGCGVTVETQSFLAAAQQNCPQCAQPLIGGAAPPPPAAVLAPAALENARTNAPRLAKEWERRGMIVGGLIGSLGIALVGAVGGGFGLAVVGAVGGAAVGLFLGGMIGMMRSLVWGIHWGDYSLLNSITLVHVLGGLMFGAWAGSELKQMSLFILTLAVLAGLVMGVACGAVVGGIVGLTAEIQPCAGPADEAVAVTGSKLQ